MMREINFDGLVGPTHNYAGLAFGNVASANNAGQIANPKAAALQGLAKMKRLHDLGLPQAVLPPHPRPDMRLLHALGFKGTVREVMASVVQSTPQLLPYLYSSSAMWTANAATITPSADTEDGKTHLTPANLIGTPHRALEPAFTTHVLKAIFGNAHFFTHHAPLPATALLGDEGAANHMRLNPPGSDEGVHIFVYGKQAGETITRYPARQSRLASEAVARRHGIKQGKALFFQQSPAAIDAGVFHNDVIATSNDRLLIYHEKAYVDGDRIADAVESVIPGVWHMERVSEAEVSLEAAVSTYLFNSQILTLPSGDMLLLAPTECAEHPRVSALINRWCEDTHNPIASAEYVDLKQSMRNGGGPACLRLRVSLLPEAWQAVHEDIKYSATLHNELTSWIEKHYRDRLAPADLADPALAEEAIAALEALAGILKLKGLYE